MKGIGQFFLTMMAELLEVANHTTAKLYSELLHG